MYRDRKNSYGQEGNRINGQLENIAKIVTYIERGDGDLVSIFGSSGFIASFASSSDSMGRTKAHQIRRFYDYLVSIDDTVRSGSGDHAFEKSAKLRLIRMVPLAAYSASPGRNLLGRDLYDFISKSAQAVSKQTGKDFLEGLSRFRDVYEAIVAYSKG